MGAVRVLVLAHAAPPVGPILLVEQLTDMAGQCARMALGVLFSAERPALAVSGQRWLLEPASGVAIGWLAE
jgi:hypothetical protein